MHPILERHWIISSLSERGNSRMKGMRKKNREVKTEEKRESLGMDKS
jgi:hypothetical protein